MLVCCKPGTPTWMFNSLFHAFSLFDYVDKVFNADLSGLSKDRLDVLTGAPVEKVGKRRTPRTVKLA